MNEILQVLLLMVKRSLICYQISLMTAALIYYATYLLYCNIHLTKLKLTHIDYMVIGILCTTKHTLTRPRNFVPYEGSLNPKYIFRQLYMFTRNSPFSQAYKGVRNASVVSFKVFETVTLFTICNFNVTFVQDNISR